MQARLDYLFICVSSYLLHGNDEGFNSTYIECDYAFIIVMQLWRLAAYYNATISSVLRGHRRPTGHLIQVGLCIQIGNNSTKGMKADSIYFYGSDVFEYVNMFQAVLLPD